MEYRLLEKTELWVQPLRLNAADLSACAQAVAGVLGLSPQQVMVTDAQTSHLVFDVLVPTVKAEQVVARRQALLDALAQVPGVELEDDTEVHSDGILGLISLEPGQGREVLERTRRMGEQIAERIRRRVKVFPTGAEVIKGQIKDRNTPYLVDELNAAGYKAQAGPPLPDDTEDIARALFGAVEEGWGLVVTTGGVGAEGKDQTVEALLRLDPSAATPYFLKFEKGQGRHAKEGVRLGVGALGQAFIVCLPGPHDEVRLAWPVLRAALGRNLTKQELAGELAEAIRNKFLSHKPPAWHAPEA